MSDIRIFGVGKVCPPSERTPDSRLHHFEQTIILKGLHGIGERDIATYLDDRAHVLSLVLIVQESGAGWGTYILVKKAEEQALA